MEEVSTTAVLENEILESARKKALKVGKDGEIKRQTVEREFMNAVLEEEASLERKLGERIARVERELTARLPLEKKRISLELAQGKLDSELEYYFGSMGRDELFGCLKPALESVKTLFASSDCEVFYSGLSEDEAKAWMVSSNAAASSWKFSPFSGGTGSALPELKIENADRTLAFRTGVRELMERLESNRRGELLRSLYGERLKP